MKNCLIRTFAICLALGFVATLAVAQNDTISAAAGDRYVISARAGGVNYVEGTVAVVRTSGQSGLLLKGDTLQVGDRVFTSANGKAEILLNPGSFLRLGGGSTFGFNTTSLDDLEIRLDGGSAVLEVYAAAEFKVNVRTPSAMYSLVKSGVFRIDVPAEGASTLKVWKGVATVGTENVVKPGRTATASSSNSVAVSKFDRDTKDALDEWSKSRSKALAQQSASLRRNDIRVPLMRGFLGGRWNFMNSFGLWVFDPFMSGYSFLPFNYGWYSPYGYAYGNGMSWWFEMNYPTYLPPTSGGTGTGTGTGTSSNSDPRTVAGVRHQREFPAGASEDRARGSVPPFIRMEQASGGGIRNGRDRDYSSDTNSTYTPTYSPSSSGSSAPPPSTSGGSGPSVEGKAPRGFKP